MNARANAQPRPAPTARQNASTEQPRPRPHSAYESFFKDPRKDPRRKERMKHGFSPEDPDGDEPMAKNTSSYSRSRKERESFAHMFAATDDDESNPTATEMPAQSKPKDAEQSKEDKPAPGTTKESSATKENISPEGSRPKNTSHPTKEPPSPSTSSSGTSSDSNPPPSSKRNTATPRSRKPKAYTNSESTNHEQNAKFGFTQFNVPPPDSSSKSYLFGTWATGGSNSWLNNGVNFDFTSNTTTSNIFSTPFTFTDTQNKSKNEGQKFEGVQSPAPDRYYSLFFPAFSNFSANSILLSSQSTKPQPAAPKFEAPNVGGSEANGKAAPSNNATESNPPLFKTQAAQQPPTETPTEPAQKEPSSTTSNGQQTGNTQSHKSPLETFSEGNWAEVLTPSWTQPAEWSHKSTTKVPPGGIMSGRAGPSRRTSANLPGQKSSSRPGSAHGGVRINTSDTKSTKTTTTNGFQNYETPEPMDIDSEEVPSQPAPKVAPAFARPSGVFTASAAPKSAGSNGPFSSSNFNSKPFVNLNDLRQTAPFTTTNNGSVNNLDDIGASLPFQSKAAEPGVQETLRKHGKTVLQQPPKAPKVPVELMGSSKASGDTVLMTRIWKQYMKDMYAYFQEWKRFNRNMVTHFSERQKLLETHLSPNWMNAIGDDNKVEIIDLTDDDEGRIETQGGSFMDYMFWLAEDAKIREHWNVAQERHSMTMHQLSKARKVMQKVVAPQQNA